MTSIAQSQTPPVIIAVILRVAAPSTDVKTMVARLACLDSEDGSENLQIQVADDKLVSAFKTGRRSLVRWNNPSNGNQAGMVKAREIAMKLLQDRAEFGGGVFATELTKTLPKLHAKGIANAHDLTWVIVFTHNQAREAFQHGYTPAGNLTILGIPAIFYPYESPKGRVLRTFHHDFCEAASDMLERLAQGDDYLHEQALEERDLNLGGYDAGTGSNTAGGYTTTDPTGESDSTSTSRSSSMEPEQDQAGENGDNGPKGVFPAEITGDGNSTVVDGDTLEWIDRSTRKAEKRAGKRAESPAADTGRTSSSSSFPTLSGARKVSSNDFQSNDVVNAPKSVQVLRQIIADLARKNLTPADAPLQYQRRDQTFGPANRTLSTIPTPSEARKDNTKHLD
ncbi:unnamed protein product [Zymoseptoria tritici ST99CH_1E4]|uniref:Uncharacterized protein n=1 Tax=Zymoseptoria tritici ST99CH_1E4 TaxID=1276532 RepID=A0A2H1GCP6_ZYMTR|nr:unnamed protein product [Zymoseptoria tritici ST99CH_1E4]